MVETRILVVEDEDVIAQGIKLMLENLGYDVPAIAATGEKAIALADEAQPNLVLMDIELNGALDGIETVEQIHARHNIPVVYLTAHSDSETLTRARVTEPFGYLVKPFDERELRSTVEIALYKHMAEDALRKAKDELETEVEKRTAELQETNQQLLTEITERKRAEEALQKAKGELEQRVEFRTAELRRTNEQLLSEVLERKRAEEAERQERVLAQTLQKTAEALASSIDLERTLDLIVDRLGEVVEFDRAMLMLIEGSLLRVVAVSSTLDQSNIPGNTYDYANIPLFYESLTTGKPLVVSDLREDPRWTPLPGFDVTSGGWIGTPLVAWDVIIGFLSISCDEPSTYGKREVRAVKAFAQQAALAVENTRIVLELEKKLEELREAEAQLIRTERLSVAGEIAAGVAHQINNPLGAIIAQTHLLLKRLAPDSPAHDSAMVIKRAAYRAGTIVERMLDFSRPNSYRMQLLDVNLSLQSPIVLARPQLDPSIQLVIDLTPDLPPVMGSQEHLEDVWINLLLNARDAIGGSKDGTISITTSLDDEWNAVEVNISDTGAGIPAECLGRVFDPFFTTKLYSNGTGLGLSICHDVVARHAGTIEAKSEELQGTTFTVRLPAAVPDR